MTTYALDTNAVIDVLNGRRPVVRERWRRAIFAGASITISSVVLFELWYGAARAPRRRENADRLHVFLSGDVETTAFDDEDALAAGDLRAILAAAGTPIGAYDLLIAAQTLRSRATLVTANVAEFGRVPDLVWEDWTVEV
ncbi:MAG TPA: type II toxin-antitoxin system VapC family toxin [Caulobacteraceae bacterium]|nr:type II toxin-antitoxin system VapC family toxin [Caulobacteraceae bacterium]